MDGPNRTGTPPPGRPPGPPPAPPAGSPPPPPQPPPEPTGGTLVLKVSRRMLWVGTAAFPLHNITMVDAFRMRPDRGSALGRAVKALFGAVVIYGVINVMTGGEARIGENGNPTLIFVLIIAVLFIAFKGLFAADKPVLAVQVSSGATVVVTLPSMEELRQIAARIAHAIDNPAAEFATVVNTYNTTNFGSAAIVNGGQGNGAFKL